MRNAFASILLCTLFLPLLGQTTLDPHPCSDATHQEFSFWLGDWKVFDPTGKEVGTNHIISKESGCLMQENWISASGGTGTSYNFYDKGKKLWTQVWVDNSGGSLYLTGSLENKSMVLLSELLPGKKVDFYRNRITWTPNEDGSVRQLWEILDENGAVLSVAFDGLYKKTP